MNILCVYYGMAATAYKMQRKMTAIIRTHTLYIILYGMAQRSYIKNVCESRTQSEDISSGICE